jgi:hypothetical protein
LNQLPRPTSIEQRGDLKRMTRASLRMVTAAKFALVTRYETGQLSKFGSDHPDDENKFLPVDVLADLQMELPRGVAAPLLDLLAAIGGFRLVPLDDAGGGAGIDLDDVGAMLRENGEAEAAALAAAGSASLATVRQARKEIGEARAVASLTDHKLAVQERSLLRRTGGVA